MENKDRQFKITSPSGTEFVGGSPEEFAAMFQKLSTNGRVDLIEQVHEGSEAKEQAKRKEERESQKEVEAVVRAYLASSKRLAQLEKELEECKQKDMNAYLDAIADDIVPLESVQEVEDKNEQPKEVEAVPENTNTTNENTGEDIETNATDTTNETISVEQNLKEQKTSLLESITTDEEALEKTSWFKFKKRRELKKSIKSAKQELQRVEKSELDVDKKEKGFLYFATNKITNPYAHNALFNKKLNSMDLRWLQDKDVYEFMRNRIEMVGQDEGFFEFNAFGLVKIIKNVKEVRSKEGINLYSEDALYKILGPDGTVIADDIKGYTEATDLYYKATNEYRDVLEKEFSELPK